MTSKAFKARRFSRRQVVLAAVGLLVLVIAGISWKRLQSDTQNTSKLFKVQRKNIAQSLQLSGKIFPEKTMVITAQQSGRIVALDVKEGAKVEPNDLLFTMQLEAAGQTELMDLRARVRALEYEVGSASKLVKNKSLVKELIGVDQVAREESDLQKMRLELDSARERLSIMESNLGLSQAAPKARNSAGTSGLVYVRSPIQGIVTLVDKRPGDFVMGGAGMSAGVSEVGGSNDRMVMVVADMSKLQVRIKVMEADLRFVKQGLPVKVRLDAYPDIAYDGEVEQIGGQGRAETKAGYTYFDVYVGVNQKDARLLPEMNATVDLIFAEQENALTLPVSCVLMLPTQSYVRLQDSKNPQGFRYAPVQTGAINAIDVQIVSGLKEGDEVMEIDFASPQIFEVAEGPGKTAKNEAVKQ
ncbi:MAG TPA: efflux RND transporter periplasmic adaptor subunit [Oligoflexus sp.]|uniref:efflux RND transporter periplasmic adaptor subunit n=1 Tax=Oligoflexus sp. TaxID=1971216 RepID=UPI002D568C68|nr:efflux RND transporter periplasmic adaptor subunit [Oligoflexus sp.]HYX36660.1 efflux RND transporter periplasmic adaptor subunit [Oligoflexus sp.]